MLELRQNLGQELCKSFKRRSIDPLNTAVQIGALVS